MDGTPNATDDVPAERRRRPRDVAAERVGTGVRLVLSLPEHRLKPGQTIAFDDEHGQPCTTVLPDDVRPGRPMLVRAAGADSEHPVELLLVPF